MELEILKLFYVDKTVTNNSRGLFMDLFRVFSQPLTEVIVDSVIIK